MKFHSLLASLVTSLCLAQAAHTEPIVAIESPVHGAPLRADWVEVNGRVEGLEKGRSYELRVQGGPVVIAADGSFSASVPIYPLIVTGLPGAPPPSYPYRDWAGDDQRVFRPVLVSLLEVGASTPVAMDRILLHDLREYDAALVDAGEELSGSVGYQLTPDGLRDVATFLPDLFWLSDPGPLNETVSDQVGLGLEVVEDGFGTECTNVVFFPELLTRKEFFAISVEAIALINANNAAIASTGVPILATLPTRFFPWQVQVCVDEIRALVNEVTVDDVDRIALEPDSGFVLAGTVLDGIDATADVTLASLLRYPRGLWLIPDHALPDESLFCPAQAFTATSAASNSPSPAAPEPPILLSVEPDAADTRRLEVRQMRPSEFALAGSTLGRDGPCDAMFIRDEVDLLAAPIEEEIEELLSSAWDEEEERATQQSESLRIGLTTFEDAAWDSAYVESRAYFERVQIEPRKPGPKSVQGLRMELGTGATARGADVPEVMFIVENLPLPEFGFESPYPYDTPFDLAVTVSTGALNQVLADASVTELLNRMLEPSYEELGLCIPEVGSCGLDSSGACTCDAGGSARTGRASLDGETLAFLLPQLAAIGEEEAELRLRSTLPPVVTMWQDELYFHAGQLLLEFVSPDPEGGEIVWMQAAIDVYDDRFGISLERADGQLTSDIALGHFDATILDHSLASRPPRSSAELALGPLVANRVVPALAEAIAELPVPEFEEVPTLGYVPFDLDEQPERFQEGENITIFTNLDPAP